MPLRICISIWAVCIFGFLNIGWTVENPELGARCFIVLESPSVLTFQHELSGESPIASPQFQAKRPQALEYARTLASEQKSLSFSIQAVAPDAVILRSFTELVNALTVQVSPEYWEELRNLPGVAYIAPVQIVKPMLTQSGSLMDQEGAWDLVGGGENAGDGVFIGVIDTGVDHTHPAFSDEGYSFPDGFPKGETQFTNKKIIAARVFPPRFGNKGDTTPRDRVGHGTNVSSIAAANYNTPSPLGPLSGVAPRAYIGNYKVFTNALAETDQIIAAIEQAVLDGVDIINLSLGTEQYSDSQHDLQVQAVRNAIDLGVVICVAAANGGKENTIGNPAQVDEAITVGATTNSHISSGFTSANEDLLLTIFADGQPVLRDIPAVFGGSGGPFTDPILGSFPLLDGDLLDGGSYGTEQDGLFCTAPTGRPPINAWVLVQRGVCLFTDKVENARLIGSRGVIFFDDAEHSTTEPLNIPSVPNTTIPSIMIRRDKGLEIKEVIYSAQSVVVEVRGGRLNDRSSTPNRLAVFSSLGPSARYVVKPDVVAVGSGSFGATQNDIATESSFVAGGFDWFSGTSMACPRVAGLAALLKQKNPGWFPSWIKSAIQLGAQLPVPLAQSPSQNAGVTQRGSGRVNAEASLLVDTVAVPSIIGFGKQTLFASEELSRWISVINPSASETYSYSLVPQQVGIDPRLEVSTGEFTLGPRERVDVRVSLFVSTNIFTGDYEPTLLLTNQTTQKSYSIPTWVRIKRVNPPVGDILLIDDDEGLSYENFYGNALTQLGYRFTPWNVESLKEYPTYNLLKHYKTVIWFLAEKSLNSFPNEDSPQYIEAFNKRHLYEEDLMQYLAEGGSLLLSGQDYFDDRETAAFTQDLLGVNMAVRDIGANTVSGVIENPVGKGVGPFSLMFPPGFDNFPDRLVPLYPEVKPAFYADNQPSKTVGVTIDTCSYRAVFLAFPLEVMEESAARAIIRNSLQWLQEATFEPTRVTAVSPQQVDLLHQAGQIPITIQGNNFSLHYGYRAHLGDYPVLGLVRQDCNTLTGVLPADIQPANYSLRLVTGEGQELRLENALRVLDTSQTSVLHWSLY